MAAVMALIGLPIAFTVTMLFLMTTSHAISAGLGIGLIISLALLFVATLRFVQRLETPDPRAP
jgi:hypothetical protein